MNTDKIFLGDIRKCTKYEVQKMYTFSTYINDQCIGCDSFGYVDCDDELFKEKAILIKIENGGYVDLENLNSILDYIKIYRDIKKDGYRLGGLMMSTSPHCVDSLFVDQDSLRPYYAKDQQVTDIPLRKLKKQVNNNR